MSQTEIIILAAGKGKRMGADGPKALTMLKGKSFLHRLTESVKKVFHKKSPIIVVGHQKELVKNALGAEYRYAHQDEQLGTGHAVLVARDLVGPDTSSVMVLYADHPLLSTDTIQSLATKHREEGAVHTMATIQLPHWNDWYKDAFYNFGRIVRDTSGKILGIVEQKDASPEELEITEVNPAYFCFDNTWLWKELSELRNENAQKEYYLTDLVKKAFETGAKIITVTIDPKEGLGANTKEQLAFLEQFVD